MTQGSSCRLSAGRPEFIPQDTLDCRRQIRSALKSCCVRCASRRERNARRTLSARLRWRKKGGRLQLSRIALREKFWRRHAVQADLATIRCSTSLPLGKHLPNFPPKKKISAAIEGRLSANCWRRFPPCYSFGSYGHEIEEKNIAEEKACGGKIKRKEIREDGRGRQAGACGGNGPEARGGNPRKTG